MKMVKILIEEVFRNVWYKQYHIGDFFLIMEF